MKKYAVMLGLLAIGVGAFAGDITIFDGVSNAGSYFGTPWYGGGTFDSRIGVNGVAVREDHEVEANCVGNQVWDLEAFTLNNNQLGMVGGYNFRDGQENMRTGDIFIAVGDPPTILNTTGGTSNPAVLNTYNYDYAIRLTFNPPNSLTPNLSTGTYTVYALNSNSYVSVVDFAQNGSSNPWRYSSGGSVVANAGGTFSFASGLTDAQTGFNGGNHYAIEGVDLSFITGGQTIYTHYTMECGNDNLAGKATLPVPEPGSLILFGTGLLGLISLSIGRRKK
jgi:hypothetical protein